MTVSDAGCSSSILAIMCDEATDLRNRTELLICIRYLMKEGISVESFVHIVPISDAKAETITNSIVTTLDTTGIDMTRVVWIVFDGASNMYGHKSGVQARLREKKCPNAHYVHCRSHVLQLACVHAGKKIKPIKNLFSALNSLYRFFSLSPLCTGVLREIQEALEESANDSGLPLIDSSQMSDDEIHSKFVSPYIKALSDMMKRRFDDTV